MKKLIEIIAESSRELWRKLAEEREKYVRSGLRRFLWIKFVRCDVCLRLRLIRHMRLIVYTPGLPEKEKRELKKKNVYKRTEHLILRCKRCEKEGKKLRVN